MACKDSYHSWKLKMQSSFLHSLDNIGLSDSPRGALPDFGCINLQLDAKFLNAMHVLRNYTNQLIACGHFGPCEGQSHLHLCSLSSN